MKIKRPEKILEESLTLNFLSVPMKTNIQQRKSRGLQSPESKHLKTKQPYI